MTVGEWKEIQLMLTEYKEMRSEVKKLQAADGRPREVKNCGGRKKRRLADEEASPLPLPDLTPYTDVVADASEIGSPEQQEGEAEVSVPPILGAVAPRPGSAHSFDSVCQRFLEDNDSWYDGLGVLQPDQREEVVGLRLTTLVLRLETQGLGYRTYEDTVDFLDGLGVTFHRPMAPQSETTRMIIYESRRLPPDFLKNLLTMAVSIAIILQRTIADKKAKSERSGHKTTAQLLGREMLDPSMLLFISLRYDVRIRGVLRYAHAAQKQAMSGCAKLAMAVETLQVLRACSAAAQGLLGAARAWQVLATFMDGCTWPRNEQATRAQRHAFIGTMAMEAAGKKLPTACNVLLELLFKRQIRGFRGLGMGLHEEDIPEHLLTAKGLHSDDIPEPEEDEDVLSETEAVESDMTMQQWLAHQDQLKSITGVTTAAGEIEDKTAEDAGSSESEAEKETLDRDGDSDEDEGSCSFSGSLPWPATHSDLSQVAAQMGEKTTRLSYVLRKRLDRNGRPCVVVMETNHADALLWQCMVCQERLSVRGCVLWLPNILE
eukprot:s6495_g1.t1